jgi:hypothetical protein
MNHCHSFRYDAPLIKQEGTRALTTQLSSAHTTTGSTNSKAIDDSTSGRDKRKPIVKKRRE